MMLDIALYGICIAAGLIGIPMFVRRAWNSPILFVSLLPLVFVVPMILHQPREQAIGLAMCLVLAVGAVGLEPVYGPHIRSAADRVQRVPHLAKITVAVCGLILGSVSLAMLARSVIG